MKAKDFKNKWKSMIQNLSSDDVEDNKKADFDTNKIIITDAVEGFANNSANANNLTQDTLNNYYKKLTGKDYQKQNKDKDKDDTQSKIDVAPIATLVTPDTTPGMKIFYDILYKNTGSVLIEASKPGFDFTNTTPVKIQIQKSQKGGDRQSEISRIVKRISEKIKTLKNTIIGYESGTETNFPKLKEKVKEVVTEFPEDTEYKIIYPNDTPSGPSLNEDYFYFKVDNPQQYDDKKPYGVIEVRLGGIKEGNKYKGSVSKAEVQRGGVKDSKYQFFLIPNVPPSPACNRYVKGWLDSVVSNTKRNITEQEVDNLYANKPNDITRPQILQCITYFTKLDKYKNITFEGIATPAPTAATSSAAAAQQTPTATPAATPTAATSSAASVTATIVQNPPNDNCNTFVKTWLDSVISDTKRNITKQEVDNLYASKPDTISRENIQQCISYFLLLPEYQDVNIEQTAYISAKTRSKPGPPNDRCSIVETWLDSLPDKTKITEEQVESLYNTNPSLLTVQFEECIKYYKSFDKYKNINFVTKAPNKKCNTIVKTWLDSLPDKTNITSDQIDQLLKYNKDLSVIELSQCITYFKTLDGYKDIDIKTKSYSSSLPADESKTIVKAWLDNLPDKTNITKEQVKQLFTDNPTLTNPQYFNRILEYKDIKFVTDTTTAATTTPATTTPATTTPATTTPATTTPATTTPATTTPATTTPEEVAQEIEDFISLKDPSLQVDNAEVKNKVEEIITQLNIASYDIVTPTKSGNDYTVDVNKLKRPYGIVTVKVDKTPASGQTPAQSSITISKKIQKGGSTTTFTFAIIPSQTLDLNPLQLAALVGDTTIVRTLIQLGADFKVVTSDGQKLSQLVARRPKNDPYSKDILRVIQAAEKAESAAYDDFYSRKPLDEKYGLTFKEFSGMVNSVYKQKYLFVQTGKTQQTFVNEDIRKVKQQAKQDALKGKRDEKYVEDETGERVLEVNQQLVDAYNNEYELERAKLRGKQHSERNQKPRFKPEPINDVVKVKDATTNEYRDKYSIQGKREESYNKGFLTLEQRGFNDGISGKPKSQRYSSSALGLSPQLSQLVGLVVTSTEESQEYDRGYNNGVKEFVNQIEDLKLQAETNGEADANEGNKYKRTGEIKFKDKIYKIMYDKIDKSYKYVDENNQATNPFNIVYDAYEKGFRQGTERSLYLSRENQIEEVVSGGKTYRRKKKTSKKNRTYKKKKLTRK